MVVEVAVEFLRNGGVEVKFTVSRLPCIAKPLIGAYSHWCLFQRNESQRTLQNHGAKRPPTVALTELGVPSSTNWGQHQLKMLKMLRFTIILFSLLIIPTRANLGDSVAQCVARYGKPIGFSEANEKLPFGTIVFTATGYTLVVFLNNTKEVGARVSKLDKSAFSDAEMKQIMDADASTPWTSTPSDDPTCLRWTRADKATVLYDKDKHVLIFTSPEMADALKTPR